MFWMRACISIIEFFGPKIALAYRLDANSQGPKNSQIPGSNPLPLALVTDMHTSNFTSKNHHTFVFYFYSTI